MLSFNMVPEVVSPALDVSFLAAFDRACHGASILLIMGLHMTAEARSVREGLITQLARKPNSLVVLRQVLFSRHCKAMCLQIGWMPGDVRRRLGGKGGIVVVVERSVY